MRYFMKIVIIAWCCCLSLPLLANQAPQFHGFIAQGMIDVAHNNFVTDDSGFSFKLSEIGINGSYDITNNLRVAAQAVYLHGGNRYKEGVRLDYFLLDWSLVNNYHWQVDLYLGRYKNDHWLYSSTRDIPHARPSIILPQSIYYDGFRDIAMGADGAALKISHSSDTLGDFDFSFSSGRSIISQKQHQVVLSKAAIGSVEQDFDTQMSFYWQPAFSAWRYGITLLVSDFHYYQNKQTPQFDPFFDGKFSFQYYAANVNYQGERWQFSSEISQSRFRIDDFYFPGFYQERFGQGAFIQAQYQFTENVNLLARVERYYVDKNDRNGEKLALMSQGQIPKYFAFQHDVTTGLSYDIKANVRLQLEYHWVNGTARANPITLPNPLVNNRQHWNFWAAQIMYWF